MVDAIQLVYTFASYLQLQRLLDTYMGDVGTFDTERSMGRYVPTYERQKWLQAIRKKIDSLYDELDTYQRETPPPSSPAIRHTIDEWLNDTNAKTYTCVRLSISKRLIWKCGEKKTQFHS